MGLEFKNLDAQIRKYMTEEITRDTENSTIYISPWLTPQGAKDWPALLLIAAETGTDDSLADALRKGRIKQMAERKKPSGGTTEYRIPDTAPDTMSGEFNLYYIRGLCRRAIDVEIPHLVIYRARHSEKPRPESEALIGNQINPKTTLEDLRTSQGQTPKLGFPPGPNSGLSARLP